MSLNRNIALKYMRSNHSFGFISFNSILSIIGLMLGIGTLIIISAFSNGFSTAFHDKLSDLYGHIRIEKLYNQTITDDDYEYILNSFSPDKQIVSVIPYNEKRVLLRKGKYSEGLILYGIPGNNIKDAFNIHNYLHSGDISNLDSTDVILGYETAKNLNLEIGDNIYFFDIDKMINEHKTIGQQFIISGIIRTGFTEYDKLLAITTIENQNRLFNTAHGYSGIMINTTDCESSISIVDRYSDKISNEFSLIPWQHYHSELYRWLSVYDIPIKLLLVFVTLIAVFNIIAILWMIVIEKTKDIGILKSIGFSSADIRTIFLIQGTIIGLIGAILGTIFGGLFILLQIKYRFISLSSSIYFLDYLPAKLTYDLLYYPLIAILLAIISSLIPSIKAQKIQPAEAVRYE